MHPPAPHETFPVLASLAGVRHAFLQRVPALDVRTDRETAMARLAAIQRSTLDAIGFAEIPLARAEQIHSNKVALVSEATPIPAPGADALVTTTRGIVLGIHVADCAAIYFVDRQRRGIALAHSGRKGTELAIATATLDALLSATGAHPSDIVAQISPCIRPPNYEVDFAAAIRAQLALAGVCEIHDSLACTHADPDRYYSYRREQGRTGRLLAALALV